MRACELTPGVINRTQSNVDFQSNQSISIECQSFDWFSIAFSNRKAIEFLHFLRVRLHSIGFDYLWLNSIGFDRSQSKIQRQSNQSNFYILFFFDCHSIEFDNRIPIVRLAFDWIRLIRQSKSSIDYAWLTSLH